MRFKEVGTAILVAVMMCTTGCGGSHDKSAAGGSDTVTSVTVANGLAEPIRSILVQGIGDPISYRPMQPGSRTSLRPAGDTGRPGKVTVRWTDADGDHHQGRVEVTGRASGSLTLTIKGDDHVVVSRG